MNIRQEITGKTLDEFTKFNKGQYESELQLCNRYGLKESQLYEFLQKTGKLFPDGTIMEYLFRSKNGFPFGPVVPANNTLYYLSIYWDRAFTDVKNTPALKEILKTDNSLQQALKITPVEDNIDTPTRKIVKKVGRNTSNKPYWRHSYIATRFIVKKGKLYNRITGRLIDNPDTGNTNTDGNEYVMTALIHALENGIDYAGVKTLKYNPQDSPNKQIIEDNGVLTPPQHVKLQVIDLAIRAHAINSSKTVEQYYNWMNGELVK